jgi:uncharacterized membrane protein
MDRPLFDAVIHPYRSLGADGFRILFFVILALNAVGAIVSVLLGAWPIIGFLGLDVLALYWAFRASYAQALAFERVVVDRATLTVERVSDNGARQEWRFPSYWVSVWFDGDEERGTITLRSHGRALEIGAYLSPFERKSFAEALREALAAAKASTAQA